MINPDYEVRKFQKNNKTKNDKINNNKKDIK